MEQKIKPVFQISIEQAFILLALGLGFGIRLFHLGAEPLSDSEARWALQALELARGNPIQIGPQPATVTITSLLFSLFGDTNGMARLWSALTGSLLPLVPVLFASIFRSSARLHRAGIILAFGLALDPGLVALSRLSGGPMGAITFSLLAAGAAYSRKPRWSGILGGLALLSGPDLIQGILGGILAWLAWTIIARSSLTAKVISPLGPNSEKISRSAWKEAVIFGAGTVILVGTLLLCVPQGLAAFVNLLPAYLQNWGTISPIPASRLLAILLTYQPLLVIVSLVMILFGWLRPVSPGAGDHLHPILLARLLSLWGLLAVFMSLILPGRQASDLGWAIVPLWGLTALGLSTDINLPESRTQARIALGHAALNILFFVLAWHNLLRIQSIGAGGVMMIAISGGILLMIVVAAILVAAGWSARTSWLGISWGVSGFLAIYMLFGTWSAARLNTSEVRSGAAVELWESRPTPRSILLLTETLVDLSTWKTGQPNEIDLVVMVDLPALRWALRKFDQVNYASTIPAGQLPSVILTQQNENLPTLASGYRGQDLAIREEPAWVGALPANLLNWITYRQAPTSSSMIILWVRNDLFPGGSLELTSQEQPLNLAP
jgi:hypothetical protein